MGDIIKSDVLCESDSDYKPRLLFLVQYRQPESVAPCLVFSLHRSYTARQQTLRLLSSEPNILLFAGRYPQLWSFEKSPIENPATRDHYSGWTGSMIAIRKAMQNGEKMHTTVVAPRINWGRVLGMDCCTGHSVDCPSPVLVNPQLSPSMLPYFTS